MSANTDSIITWVDPSGNLITSANGGGTVKLYGTHFHGAMPLAAIVIDAASLLAFLAIAFGYLVTWIRHKTFRQILPMYWAGLSICGITAYFALDLTNRVLHELELTFNIAYTQIDIPIDKSAGVGELLLLFVLFGLSGFFQKDDTQESSVLSVMRDGFFGLYMFIALIILFLLDLALGGLFMWLSVANMDGPVATDPDSDAGNFIRIYRDLSAAFYGGYLGGAIYYAFVALQHFRQQSRSDAIRWSPRMWFCLLTLTFLLRSILNFVYALLFGIFKFNDTQTTQFVHVAIYAPLSAIIYRSLIKTTKLISLLIENIERQDDRPVGWQGGSEQAPQDWYQAEQKASLFTQHGDTGKEPLPSHRRD